MSAGVPRVLGNTRRGVHSPRSRCPESVGAWSRCPRASSQEQSSAPGVYVGAVPVDWAGAQNAANAQTPPGGPPSCREQLGALAAPAAHPPLRAGPAAAPSPHLPHCTASAPRSSPSSYATPPRTTGLQPHRMAWGPASATSCKAPWASVSPSVRWRPLESLPAALS